jgi:hypothetical protein
VPLGDRLADRLRGGAIATIVNLLSQRLVGTAGLGERPTAHIIHNLSINVLM